MGTTLENGVYLPSEGERNCYAGLKTNWEILDQKVADVTALQQAVAGALHREIVESLPTTDIDPNTIYMILSGTSATENVYNEYMYVNNAWELIGTSATDLTNYYTKAEVDGKLLLKANDSDVVHKSGDETVGGQKVFNDINVISSSAEIGVSAGNNSFKILDKNKKTISRYEAGTFSTGMAYSHLLVNNGSDEFNGVSLYQSSANSAQLRPYSSTLSLQLGSSIRYFSDCYTSKINGVEPSSLSLPSGNLNDIIDISSYITAFDGTYNSYTVPANGWISIAVVGTAIAIVSSSWSDSRLRASSGNVRMLYPVLKNETVIISIAGTTLAYARFIPCQGNV